MNQTVDKGPQLRRLLNRLKVLEQKFKIIEDKKQQVKRERALQTARWLQHHLVLTDQEINAGPPSISLSEEKLHWVCSISDHDRSLRGSPRVFGWRPKTLEVKANKRWNLGKSRFAGVSSQQASRLILQTPKKVGDELCLLTVFFLEETGKLFFAAYFPRLSSTSEMCTWAHIQQSKDEDAKDIEDLPSIVNRCVENAVFEGLKNAALSGIRKRIHEFYVPPTTNHHLKAPVQLFKSLTRMQSQNSQKQVPWLPDEPVVYKWPILVMGMDPLAPSEMEIVELRDWTKRLREIVGVKSGDAFCKNLNNHGSVYFKPANANGERINVKATCIFGLEAEGPVVFVAGTAEASYEPIIERDLDLIVELEMEIEETEERITKHRNERSQWMNTILTKCEERASELEPKLKFALLSSSGSLKAERAVSQIRSMNTESEKHYLELAKDYDYSARPQVPSQMDSEPSPCILWKTLVRKHILKCQLAPSSCPLTLCRTVRTDAREILDNTMTDEDDFDAIIDKYEEAVEQLLGRKLCPCTLHFLVKEETEEELHRLATANAIRAKTTKKTTRPPLAKLRMAVKQSSKKKAMAGWRKLMATMVKTSVRVRPSWDGVVLDYNSDDDDPDMPSGHLSLSGRPVHSREKSRRVSSTCTINLCNFLPYFPTSKLEDCKRTLFDLVVESKEEYEAWPVRHESPSTESGGVIPWIMTTLRYTALPPTSDALSNQILSNEGKEHIGKVYAVLTFGTRAMYISGRYCLLTVSSEKLGHLRLEAYSPQTCCSLTFLIGEDEVSKLKRLHGTTYNFGTSNQELAKSLLKVAPKVLKLVKENEGMRLAIDDPGEIEKRLQSADSEKVRLTECQRMRDADQWSRDVSLQTQKLLLKIRAARKQLAEKRREEQRKCLVQSIREWTPMSLADEESQKARGYLSAPPEVFKQIDEIFNQVDEDEDGILNAEELYQLLGDLTIQLAVPEQILPLLRAKDNSKSGLTKQEVYLWLTLGNSASVVLQICQQIKSSHAQRQLDKFKAHAEEIGKKSMVVENISSYSKHDYKEQSANERGLKQQPSYEKETSSSFREKFSKRWGSNQKSKAKKK